MHVRRSERERKSGREREIEQKMFISGNIIFVLASDAIHNENRIKRYFIAHLKFTFMFRIQKFMRRDLW